MALTASRVPCWTSRISAEIARVSRWQLHQANTGRLDEWRFDGDDSHCTRLTLAQWRGVATELGLTRSIICEPDRQLPFLSQHSHS